MNIYEFFKPQNEINEYIFEFRFRPTPDMLDYRGKIAKGLIESFQFSHWNISNNRVDIYEGNKGLEKADKKIFISFKNSGVLIQNVRDYHEFHQYVKGLCEYLFNTEIFTKENLLYTTRIGLKIRYWTPFAGSFNELFSLYERLCVKPSIAMTKCIPGKLSDIGGVFTFETNDHDKIQIMSGPMEEQQRKQFFPEHDSNESVGLYFEIDSSTNINDLVRQSVIKRKSHDYLRNNIDAHNKLLRILEMGNFDA